MVRMDRQDQMTVVIDENIGADSPILQEVLTRKWASNARLLRLGNEHKGISDIEIPDAAKTEKNHDNQADKRTHFA